MPSFLERQFSPSERAEYKDARWRIDHADTPLMALRAISDLFAIAHQGERLAVQEARRDGLSWGQIAEALRRTRQSVHRQYGP